MKSFVLLIFLPGVVFGANILGIFSITSLSHQIVYRNLMLELNRRGHNVTVITPDPVRNSTLKNYREIDASSYYKIWNSKLVAKPQDLRISLYIPELFIALFVYKVSTDMCRFYLTLPEVQELMAENPKFDLMITEFGTNPCFYGLAKYSGWKYIGIFSFQTNPKVHSILGNPTTPSYISDVGFPYLDRMNIFQRLRNVIFNVFINVMYEYIMSTHDVVAKEFFGSDSPHLKEIEGNVSAVFVNTHFTMSFPRPNVPNMVEIGGPAFHLIGKTPNPLPKDVRDFVDSAEHGVVYFSLGTNVKTSNISSREEKILMEAFGKLKQKVLWKWGNENLKVDLKNVMKAKWFPQVDILAHPKTKAFVTQAGLQSIGEAIQYNVPMIVMPFFADQNHNARKLESVGAAIYMDFDTLTVDSFSEALNQILYNKTYKENIKRFSELVNDQPIPPLEKAVWWTEYVIRHQGAFHLRSPARHMNWIQYTNLDVFIVVVVVVLILIFLITISIRKLIGVVLNMFRKKTKKE